MIHGILRVLQETFLKDYLVEKDNLKTSWLKYEELIDDWLDLTVLEAGKRGPALKNRLVGDAEMCKGQVSHRHIVPHFIKGAQSVFLWRFCQFTRAKRGNVEMVKWIGKFSLLLKRLREAWMDISSLSCSGPKRTRDPRQLVRPQVRNHERRFPFSDNMTTLMFIVVSGLSDAQRERLTSSFPLLGMNVTAHTFEAVKTLFVELFCTPKSSIENPSLRVGGYGSSMNRTFIVEDFDEDEFGQWPTDEATGERGTLTMRDHVFGHGTAMSMPGSPDHSRPAR